MSRLCKIELKCGFDCIPNLQVSKNDYEMTDDGRVIVDKKQAEVLSIPVGEQRINISDSADSLVVGVFCYLEESNPDKIAQTVEKMYEDLIRTLHWLLRIFNGRVEAIKIPDKKKIAEDVFAEIGGGEESLPPDKKWIPRDDFTYMLKQKTEKMVELILSAEGKTASEEWKDFFGKTYDDSLISNQIDAVRGIFKSGDKVGFKSQQDLDEILNTLSEMTAKDLLAVFEEQSGIKSEQ